MAQVQADFPDLAQMFGAQSVYPAILGMERFRQAQQAQQGNMADQAQAMQIAKEKAPVELQHLMSQTEENRARVPYMQAQTNTLLDTLGINQAIPKEERVKFQRAKIARETSDEELNTQESQLNKILLNPTISPDDRKRVKALLDELPKIRLEREKMASQERIHAYDSETRAAATRYTADQGYSRTVEAARIRAEAAGKKVQDLKTAVLSGKMTREQLMTMLAGATMFETDEAIKQQYKDLAAWAETSKLKDKQAGAQAVPQVDPSKVPGAPLTTPQPPQATPIPGSGATPPAVVADDIKTAIEKAGWAYEPDKYEYRFSPDGKLQRKPKGKQ